MAHSETSGTQIFSPTFKLFGLRWALASWTSLMDVFFPDQLFVIVAFLFNFINGFDQSVELVARHEFAGVDFVVLRAQGPDLVRERAEATLHVRLRCRQAFHRGVQQLVALLGGFAFG